MPDPASLNIQEKLKTYESQINAVRRWLRSPLLHGQILRVLIHRLKHPESEYTSLELQVLFLLAVAEQRP